MLNALFGNYRKNLKFENTSDFIIVPLKTMYIIYTLPFLLFAMGMALRSLGAFGNPIKEKFGPIKKFLLHFCAICFSFMMWGLIVNAISGNLH